MPPKVDKKPSMSPSFEALMNSLSDMEKSRFVCAVLNGTLTDVDWVKAAQDFGSASAASMSRCYSNSLKKLDEKMKSSASHENDGTTESAEEDTDDCVKAELVASNGLDSITPPPTPVATKKPRAPAKTKAGRKGKAASEDDRVAETKSENPGSRGSAKKNGSGAGTKRKAVAEPSEEEEDDDQGVEEAVEKVAPKKKPAAKRGRPAKQTKTEPKKRKGAKATPETESESNMKSEDAADSPRDVSNSNEDVNDSNDDESASQCQDEHDGKGISAVAQDTDAGTTI